MNQQWRSIKLRVACFSASGTYSGIGIWGVNIVRYTFSYLDLAPKLVSEGLSHADVVFSCEKCESDGWCMDVRTCSPVQRVQSFGQFNDM